jgi:hypothetical protein
LVNILFFSVVALVFIWIVFDRLKEDKEWVSIIVTTENNRYNLNEKYAYLKANDIRCRIKILGERGTDQALQRGVVNVRDVQSVSLDVYYKDMEKAERLLNK